VAQRPANPVPASLQGRQRDKDTTAVIYGGIDMYASDEALHYEERRFEALQAQRDHRDAIRDNWASFHEAQVWKDLQFVEDGGYELIESHHLGGTPEAINTLAKLIARLKSERSLSTDDGLIAVGTLAVSIVTQAVSKEAERLADQTMEREE
jgi:hypothetical protein